MLAEQGGRDWGYHIECVCVCTIISVEVWFYVYVCIHVSVCVYCQLVTLLVNRLIYTLLGIKFTE